MTFRQKKNKKTWSADYLIYWIKFLLKFLTGLSDFYLPYIALVHWWFVWHNTKQDGLWTLTDMYKLWLLINGEVPEPSSSSSS